MQILLRLFLLPLMSASLGLAALAGCPSPAMAKKNDPPPLPQAAVTDPPSDAGMLSANTYAGDALASMLLKRMSSGRSILSASMVEMDRLDQSSTFGRVAMQQVASRVAQHGFRVVDVRLAEAMIINKNGEFMLSRDVCKVLADRHDAYAAMVGVYALAGSKIYVSVRALRLSDAAVIAAYEYYLPFSGEVSSLLSAGRTGKGYAASGDLLWNRYAGRGRAFPDCPPQDIAAAEKARSVPAASPAPAPAIKPVAEASAPKTAAKKPKKKKKRSVAYRASQPYPQPQAQIARSPAPGIAGIYYSDKADPLCPQDVPSNRRTAPDDCSRASAAYDKGQVVYGEAYVDRGGGRRIDPDSPPPAVGRLPY
ncbi:MAG: hypothetical protein LBD42_04500 [Desulfovibrio sp.]|jgi:hypothetical protein|nr:hypothetical protein [Desulfovibrio sp.]